MAAYTVTTSLPNPFPDPAGRPTPAERHPAKLHFEARRRGYPGQATDNRWNQADNYRDAVYVAVRRVMEAMAGASAKVLKRTGKGSGVGAADARYGEGWEPVGDHPAEALFEHCNPQDTFALTMSKYVLYRELMGRSHLYAVPGRAGKPVEVWAVNPLHLTPAFGPTERYPFGAWRLSVPTPLAYGFGAAGTAVLDARDVVDDRLPHPKWEHDGYSPLAGGGLMLDALRGVNEARKNAMEKGTSLDAFIAIPGASEDELTRVREEHRRRYSGSQGDRIGFTSGEDIKATALGIAPKDMGFDAGYEQLTNFVLSLFGVPHAVAGLTDTGSYAQLYASLIQFRSLKLQPLADDIAGVWTKHLIRPHWGSSVRLVIELPQLVDQDELKTARAALFGAGGITVNEERKRHNLPPVEGGDVPPAVYVQVVQAKMQPQPMALPGLGGATDPSPIGNGSGTIPDDSPQPDGGQADELVTNGDTNSVTDGDADNPLTSAVLTALGVQGGDGANTLVRKSWTRFTTSTGGVGARNEQGREIYGAEAEAALAAQQGGGPAGGQASAGGTAPKPGTHRVSYTVGGKSQVADVPAASEEEAHQIVTALGGKVDKPKGVGGGKAGEVTGPAPAPSADAPDDLPPTAIPIAERVIPVLKPAAAKLGRNPQARQSAESVHEWAPAAAARHAERVAAATNLDKTIAHDLFLHILEHLVRGIPGVGRAASVGIGILRRHRLHSASRRVKEAAKGGKGDAPVPTGPRPQVRDAMRQARAKQGPTTGGPAVKRPRNPAGAGSLGPRVKSLTAAAVGYALRVNKALKRGES